MYGMDITLLNFNQCIKKDTYLLELSKKNQIQLRYVFFILCHNCMIFDLRHFENKLNSQFRF